MADGTDEPTGTPDDVTVGQPAVARPRRAWIAFALGLLTPGLGQLYAGYPSRAAVFYGLTILAIPVAFVVASIHSLTPFNLVGALAFTASVTLYIQIDAVLAARRQDRAYQLRRFNRWYVYLACAVAQQFLVEASARVLVEGAKVSIQAYRNPASSMEKTVLMGDHLLADNLAYGLRLPGQQNETWRWANPARGDLVTFRYPQDPSVVFIKRVVGLPGEKLAIRAAVVFINEEPLSEPYVTHILPLVSTPACAGCEDDSQASWGPETIPEGAYFVLGDNRDNSNDSRFFGSVPRANILGRVRSVYWSVDVGRDPALPGGGRAKRIRWERIGLRLR